MVVGFNSNGWISPGKCKMGGIGGDRPQDIYGPGRVGVCSRSGGMSAEICATLSRAGSAPGHAFLGGDPIVGLRMAAYLRLFEQDVETDACVIFGEPGTDHGQGVAAAGQSETEKIRKPVVELDRRPVPGGLLCKALGFGHVAAISKRSGDSASEKSSMLREARRPHRRNALEVLRTWSRAALDLLGLSAIGGFRLQPDDLAPVGTTLD